MSAERESTGGAPVVVDPLGGLVLDPANELKFRGPFDDYVSVSLTIRNPTAKRIAFKIKTTAPKRYCVKPNSGVLDPDQTMKVNVLLQPFIYDPNEKNKHKFMVQYMYLNDNEMQYSVNEILNMWKDVSNSRLLDLKLKCIFELTESDQQRLQQQQQQGGGESKQQQQQDTSKLSASSTASKSSVSSSSFSTANKENFVQATADFDSSSSHQQQQTYAQKASTVPANSPATVAAAATTATTTLGSGGSSRLDKNDNAINELKWLKQENERLTREVARLKEEESRLRKLALQAPSSTLNKSHGGGDALADVLNNRSTLIIIVLLAIVVYLLLFR